MFSSKSLFPEIDFILLILFPDVLSYMSMARHCSTKERESTHGTKEEPEKLKS
jgi:hypothetical protein